MAKLATCMGPDCRRNKGRIGLRTVYYHGKTFCSTKCSEDFKAVEVSTPNLFFRLVASFMKPLEARLERKQNPKPSFRS